MTHPRELLELRLFDAAQAGSADVIRELVKLGANVNVARNVDGDTPLHIVCRSGNLDCVRALIEAGADPERTNIRGEMPLSLVCKHGHLPIADYLCDTVGYNVMHGLKRGPLPSAIFAARSQAATSFGSISPTTAASALPPSRLPTLKASHHRDFTKSESQNSVSSSHTIGGALETGAPTTFASDTRSNFSSITCLISTLRGRIAASMFVAEVDVVLRLPAMMVLAWACYEGHAILVRELIANNNSLKSALLKRDDSTFAPLAAASQRGHVKVVRELISAGCDVDKHDSMHRTAMWYACNEGHLPVVKLLGALSCSIRVAEDGSSPLHKACSCGHSDVVYHLLRTLYPHSPDIADSRQRTPLWWASRGGHVSTILVLRDAGANFNLADEKHVTPFSKACSKGFLDAVKVLHECGSNAEAGDKQGRSPLWHAARRCHTHIISYLATNLHCNVNTTDSAGVSALKIAVEKGSVNTVKMLIELSCDLNVQDKRGRTALFEACKWPTPDLARILVEAGAYLNVPNEGGTTPLLIATRTANTEIVRLLLKAGANVHGADKEGLTPFFVACHEGFHEIVALLIEYGCDMEARVREDKTGLIVAASRGHVKVVETLIRAKCNINNPRQNNCTALYCACSHGHTEVVRVLLREGANPDIQNTQGATALYTACHKGYDDVVEILLEHGCDLNITMAGGVTPLHVACHHGNQGAVKLLLKAGMDKNIQKDNGSTPLLTASVCGKDAVVATLIEHGCDLNRPDNQGWTPLAVACCGKFDDLALLLIRSHCDVNAGPRGITPLHLASRKGRLRVVKHLVASGCVLDSAAADGWTALMLAVHNGHADVARFLMDAGCNVNACTEDQLKPLLVACRKGHLVLAHELARHGAHLEGMYAEYCDRFLSDDASDSDPCKNLLSVYDALVSGGELDQMKVSIRLVLHLPVSLFVCGLEAVRSQVNVLQTCAYAFCMGRHTRLGADSPVQWLSVELVEMIVKEFVNGIVDDWDGTSSQSTRSEGPSRTQTVDAECVVDLGAPHHRPNVSDNDDDDDDVLGGA